MTDQAAGPTGDTTAGDATAGDATAGDTDQGAELDDALAQVIVAARAHLAAVMAADGAVDDEQVWRSYVALNNASFEYDQRLLDAYGEVTPWDTEPIDAHAAEAGPRFLTEPGGTLGAPAADPHPSVLSVRQRRDYRVPSVAALLAAAGESARRIALDDDVAAPETVAEAMLELVRDGDGSLGGLDVPELEPLDGVVTVTEVSRPLDLDADESMLFQVGASDRVVGRIDEHPYLDDHRAEQLGEEFDDLADEDDEDDEDDDGAGENAR